MRSRDRARRLSKGRSEAGYTLTEMLVVIGIIGLIAAVLTPGVMDQFARAKAKTAQLQLDTLSANIESFASDVGRYPTRQEGLKALLAEPSGAEGWTGPYLRDGRLLNDPWGRPIVYTVDQAGRTFKVSSLGADGKIGGSGVDRDLSSPSGAGTPAPSAQGAGS